MDPVTAVGLATSADQLVALVGKVLISLYRYGGDVKEAPRRSAKLRDELSTTISLLGLVEEALKERPQVVVALHGPSLVQTMSQFRELLETLERKIQADVTRGIRRLTWPFKKEEIDVHISRIERYKATFSLVLNIQQVYVVLQSYWPYKSRHSLREMSENVQDIKLDTQEVRRHAEGSRPSPSDRN